MTEFLDRYGPTALIAGGSEGVGASYAHLLAERGLDLVLVARSQDKLDALKAELNARFADRVVSTIAADLTAPDVPTTLAERTADQEIGLLVYNAGSNWRTGNFVDIPVDYLHRLTVLNGLAPMALCHTFGGRMRGRGRGGIILVSSLAYLAGSPQIAVYSAAKAYLTTLGEALWYELRPHGVDVLVHALGATDTPFIERHFLKAYGRGERPEEVAAHCLASLGDGLVIRVGSGDAFHAMLAGMSRGDAVQTMANIGKAYEG